MPSKLRTRPAAAMATWIVRALVPTFLLVLAHDATAQVSSQDKPAKSMAITVGGKAVAYFYRIDRIAASQGVRRHDVVCAPRQPAGSPPGIQCDIRFDQPTKVTRFTVGETADPGNCSRPRDCWTSSLAPIAANGAEIADDSAFLFMIDQGGRDRRAVQRMDNDLVAILANAGPSQQVSVATFSRSLKIVSGFGSDKSRMSADLGRIVPDGNVTELYKSAIDAVQALGAREARRKFLVILSDGTANDTAYDDTALFNAAQAANVQIIAIGYAPNRRDTSQLQALRKIAGETNGDYKEVLGTGGQLSAQDRKSFMSRYSSGYLLTADSPSRSLPPLVDVSLRFDGGGTSLIPVDIATTPSPGGASPGAGGEPIMRPKSILERLYDNWILTGAVVAALLAVIVGLLVSSRARSRQSSAPVQSAAAPDYPAQSPAPSPAPTPPPRSPQPPHPRFADDEDEKTIVHGDLDGVGTRVAPSLGGDAGKPITFVEIDDHGDQSRVPILKNLARIGRSQDNDIVLPAEHVSREHAEISSDGNGGWEIRNRTWRRPATEGGVNPIEVNGHRIDAETHPLRDGDVIRLGNIGNTHLTFRHNAQR